MCSRDNDPDWAQPAWHMAPQPTNLQSKQSPHRFDTTQQLDPMAAGSWKTCLTMHPVLAFVCFFWLLLQVPTHAPSSTGHDEGIADACLGLQSALSAKWMQEEAGTELGRVHGVVLMHAADGPLVFCDLAAVTLSCWQPTSAWGVLLTCTCCLTNLNLNPLGQTLHSMTTACESNPRFCLFCVIHCCVDSKTARCERYTVFCQLCIFSMSERLSPWRPRPTHVRPQGCLLHVYAQRYC